jgi:hypothetical protein
MSTLAPLPSLPAISSSTGVDYSGLSPDEVDSALNSPLTNEQINQAMGYNYTGIVAPTDSPQSTATIPSIPSVGTVPTQSISTTATTPASSTMSAAQKSSLIENIVFAVLGILLIAAGIFSFKTSQTIVQVAGKAASKGAELGAVAA